MGVEDGKIHKLQYLYIKCYRPLAIRAYEESSRETVQDALKIALVQRGVKEVALRDHLLLNSARLETCNALWGRELRS